MKGGWVYILECSDGRYYTGCTSDLSRRLEEHENGGYCRYTAARLPLTLVFSQRFPSIDDAIRAEKQIKGWSRKKKEALIREDYNALHELARCLNQTHYR
ncbi:MAG: GIY-YIG nuclease family protein, partial [Candidatus Zixiibacteriota bacterium]